MLLLKIIVPQISQISAENLSTVGTPKGYSFPRPLFEKNAPQIAQINTDGNWENYLG
jgi:hypothetical protein